MASGILYSYPDNYRTFQILIAAQYGGGTVKFATDFVVGETNNTLDFLAKFPLGTLPAFESKEGHCIAESNAISFFVANDELRGSQNSVARAQVIQWMSYADSEILPSASVWTFPYLGIMDFNKQDVAQAKDQIKNVFAHLNDFLLAKTYLVGERLTLADVTVACALLNLYKLVLEPGFRKDYQNVNRWFTTIVNQPKVKAVIGEFKFCEGEPKIPAKNKGGSGDQQQGKKKKEKEQAPKEPSKKESLPKVEPEPLDETELALAAEPKSKDPFEALPKGTFNMDDFKRCYSNEEAEKSIPYFWEKFDPENYSIWLGEYKYNDELQKVFMSCNLITGMFQRLDKMRKNAFASVCLFGKDNESTISGIWVWRGHELAFNLSKDWEVDYESYSWTKLDTSKPENKKLVDGYLAWEIKDKEGRPFNQGKIFK